MQKVFFEVMKQHQGEYMGSLLSAWLESMGGQLRDDDDGRRATLSKETMDAGLNLAVKDNDSRFPPEWRLSRSGRRRPDIRLTVTQSQDGRTGRTPVAPPLSGLRVVDLSTWIGGAYCTKLLADGGAEVIKVESPEGDPLRRWSASGAAIPPDADGALFNFLSASKRASSSTARSAGRPRTRCTQLLASADAVVWSRGSPVAEHATLAPREILGAHPHLIVTSITPFGLEGPWSDKPATEFTLQAWSGGDRRAGPRAARPCRRSSSVARSGSGSPALFGAIGTLAAGRRAAPGGELVDVSMLEALAMCLTYYPVTFNDQLGRPMRRKRFVPTPGVGAASDGLVGLGCGTGQQWLDFCVHGRDTPSGWRTSRSSSIARR